MGNSLDRLGGYTNSSESSDGDPEAAATSGCSRKRKKSVDDDTECSVKLTKLDTAKYVYERLFLHGESSDIRIHALGETWNLHKLYLQQCDYFEALLGGDWADSNGNEFTLDIPDENVTVDGLRAVFASLYNNEIEYEIGNIPGIVAAASLFQLGSVLNRCDEELVAAINEVNVVQFLNISGTYGLKKVRSQAMKLLKWNFWRLKTNYKLLHDLQKDDLLELLSSTDLLVVEGEIDFYRLLKTWIFLKNSDESVEIGEEAMAEKVSAYLKSATDDQDFMENAPLFASLRLHHLLKTSREIAEVEQDRLIPREIIRALMVDLWKTTLSNEENPSSSTTITEEDFYLNCIRLGRVVDSSPKCWRWTGFNHGVDILLNYHKGLITLKRNCLHSATPYSVNLKSDRVVHFRLVMCDSAGRCLHDSGKTQVSLHTDQTVVVCRLPEPASLPVAVHLFYLAAQPPPPSLLYVNQYVRSRVSQTI